VRSLPVPIKNLYRNFLCILYLGKNGVIHRGIRSSRVLLSGNGRVQLADFRLSGNIPNLHCCLIFRDT
jgi:serine/threonine protein kinase